MSVLWAAMSDTFGSVLLGLIKAKELQFGHFSFNSNEFRGTWNILYSEL